MARLTGPFDAGIYTVIAAIRGSILEECNARTMWISAISSAEIGSGLGDIWMTSTVLLRNIYIGGDTIGDTANGLRCDGPRKDRVSSSMPKRGLYHEKKDLRGVLYDAQQKSQM